MRRKKFTEADITARIGRLGVVKATALDGNNVAPPAANFDHFSRNSAVSRDSPGQDAAS